MEVLRATVVLLGVSMFFSIITSVLTASEELRVNFPSGKYLGASDKATADSPESLRSEAQVKTEDPDARINVEDIERGNVDRATETIGDEGRSSILEKVEIDDSEDSEDTKEVMQNGNEKQSSGASD